MGCRDMVLRYRGTEAWSYDTGVQRHGLTVQGYDIRFGGTVLQNGGTILGTRAGVTVLRYDIIVQGHRTVV